jgi:YidC/Oxa1 family membrane protein insertase
MHKRIIFTAMMLLLVLGLVACGGGQDPVVMVIANNPTEKIVYTEAEANNIIFRGEEGLSTWIITQEGQTVDLESSSTNDAVSYTGNLPAVFTDDGEGVRTYYYNVKGFDASFKVYIVPNDLDPSVADEIAMVVFRFERDSILYQQGQRFNPEGITAYVVFRNGDVEAVSGADYPEYFNDNGHEPLGENGFRNKYEYNVTFTYMNFVADSQEFTVYVSGGEKPIHPGDASFFDWILVIPVAFIMQFFAGALGNNFAVGILITTIIVRTLAWPIYAKSNDLSIKMNLAQPDMQRVQNKYATKKDPQSQQQMQMEMMQVYKKHGINVLGCLMPFLQMPIFIAMYGVVRRISLEGGLYAQSVSNTNFIGINLAAAGEGFTSYLLAAIVGATMFLLQKISMKKPSYAKNTASHNPNPQAQQTEKTMKYVSYFMVIMMMFISLQGNALALYWIFGNIYSLGQTLFNRKMNEKKHEVMKQKQLMGEVK